jgi:DNA mismatch endonuclease, patch repair protein
MFTDRDRGELMSRIRSSGTAPELALERIVRASLPRWKIECNSRAILGTPDIYVPSLKLAIFAQGCFWHSCPVHGTRPSSNTDYWWPKLEANLRRDDRTQRALRRQGISVWFIWEHDLRAKTIATTHVKLAKRLERRVGVVRERAS